MTYNFDIEFLGKNRYCARAVSLTADFELQIYAPTRKQAYDKLRRLYNKEIVARALDWCNKNLVKDGEDFIAYKRLPKRIYRAKTGFDRAEFPVPDSWKIEPRSFLTENGLLKDLDVSCGPGVNVATKDWLAGQYAWCDLWKIKIFKEDILKSDVIVPYETSGKFRCKRIQLIKEVSK